MVGAAPPICRVALRRDFPSPGLCVLTAGGDVTLLAEGDVSAYFWAPHSPTLVFQREADLYLQPISGPPEALLTGLVVGGKRMTAIHPEGQWLATLAAGACFVLPIVPDLGSGERIQLPSDFVPWDIQWCRRGHGVTIACMRGEEPVLQVVDLAGRTMSSVPLDCELLAARASDGRLMARRGELASGEEEAGVLTDDGRFEPLFCVPEDAYIAAYLPGPDRFLLVAAGEEADPTAFTLVSSNGLPGKPWLRRFPCLADWSFSPDGSVMAAVDQDTDRIILAKVGSEAITSIPLSAPNPDGDDQPSYAAPAPSDTNVT